MAQTPEITQTGDNSTVTINHTVVEDKTPDHLTVNVNIQEYAECEQLDISFRKFTDYVTQLVQFIHQELKDHSLSLDNISHYLTRVMNKVEEFSQLNGFNRKQIVTISMRTYVRDHLQVEDIKDNLFGFVDNVMSGLIDTIIEVDKRQLIIKSVKKARNGCIDFKRWIPTQFPKVVERIRSIRGKTKIDPKETAETPRPETARSESSVNTIKK
jgi:hypothetical protein